MYKYLVYLISLGCLISCASPKAFEYRAVKNIHLQKLGLDKSYMMMDLEYFNPNHFSLTLEKMNAEVFVEQHYIGQMDRDSIYIIPKFSTFSLPTKVDLDMKEVYKHAISFALKKEVLVTVKGTIRIGRWGIFKTIPFEYNGEQALKLF